MTNNKRKNTLIMRSFSGNTMLRNLLLLCVTGLLAVCGFSQIRGLIKIDEIPHRSVRKYIVSSGIDRMTDFSSIRASCERGINDPDLNVWQKEFLFDYSPADVWNSYRGIDPLKTWNRKSVRFGLMISKTSNSVTYISNSTLVKVDTGQVYFLNLRILAGIINIPVAFEIISIDDKRREVEYSYLEGNKARGKHVLEFLDDGEGGTRIIHSSYFKSESAFRDKYLYPVFHKKFIREFHRNMREVLKGNE